MPAPVYIDKNEGLFPMRRLAELVDSKCRQPLAEYFSVSLRWYRDLQGELLWGPRSCSNSIARLYTALVAGSDEVEAQIATSWYRSAGNRFRRP
jgi:hypothetical protein